MQTHYENTPLRSLAGGCLRPGGLELTRRGVSLCALPPGSRVLDLGCGPGASLGLLREMGFSSVGVDISAVFLKEAREQDSVVRADFSRLPFVNDCCDGVLCECVLSLAENKTRLLAECARVLKPGGRLMLTDLCWQDNPTETPALDCFFGAETVADYKGMLRGLGFNLLHVEDHSRCLRQLAARIIWQYGSLSAFARLWNKETGAKDGENAGKTLTGGGVPGYILIIAEFF